MSKIILNAISWPSVNLQKEPKLTLPIELLAEIFAKFDRQDKYCSTNQLGNFSKCFEPSSPFHLLKFLYFEI